MDLREQNKNTHELSSTTEDILRRVASKNFSGRQVRWIELSKFDFTAPYVPSKENTLPNTLSCLYEFDAVGIVQASFEYVGHDPLRKDTHGGSDTPLAVLSDPVLAGKEAMATAPCRQSVAHKPVKDLLLPVAEPKGAASLPK